jgi:hypothetical protein
MRVAAKDALGLRDNFFGEQSDPVVDAILAMPEMQAIRQALHLAGTQLNLPLAVYLPNSVVQWVST